MLYIVPTPIGNLEDITLRALRVLREADVVACEDTRTSGVLLQHYQIETPRTSFHAFNEAAKADHLIARIQRGETVALISDAGTPGISDPGFSLVRAAIQAGVSVEVLPGATAFVPALVASGLPCDRFVFEGFLPVKKGRQTRMKALLEESRTMVFYESPHRIQKTLDGFIPLFGPDRPACVARELSKKFEEVVRGSLSSVRAHFGQEAKVRGEFVLIIGGKAGSFG
ncbi:MAG: 16S rRNA (cytidine(1402)-2'-O)-methyltransferase [Bacteroidetes Order II. Incertae sedis bacterium]|nr:16S rRNA (cytidine(1402)-2'-O)-methyltransferase [Bacteroidetes Order II. bacterium]